MEYWQNLRISPSGVPILSNANLTTKELELYIQSLLPVIPHLRAEDSILPQLTDELKHIRQFIISTKALGTFDIELCNTYEGLGLLILYILSIHPPVSAPADWSPVMNLLTCGHCSSGITNQAASLLVSKADLNIEENPQMSQFAKHIIIRKAQKLNSLLKHLPLLERSNGIELQALVDHLSSSQDLARVIEEESRFEHRDDALKLVTRLIEAPSSSEFDASVLAMFDDLGVIHSLSKILLKSMVDSVSANVPETYVKFTELELNVIQQIPVVFSNFVNWIITAWDQSEPDGYYATMLRVLRGIIGESIIALSWLVSKWVPGLRACLFSLFAIQSSTPTLHDDEISFPKPLAWGITPTAPYEIKLTASMYDLATIFREPLTHWRSTLVKVLVTSSAINIPSNYFVFSRGSFLIASLFDVLATPSVEQLHQLNQFYHGQLPLMLPYERVLAHFVLCITMHRCLSAITSATPSSTLVAELTAAVSLLSKWTVIPANSRESHLISESWWPALAAVSDCTTTLYRMNIDVWPLLRTSIEFAAGAVDMTIQTSALWQGEDIYKLRDDLKEEDPPPGTWCASVMSVDSVVNWARYVQQLVVLNNLRCLVQRLTKSQDREVLALNGGLTANAPILLQHFLAIGANKQYPLFSLKPTHLALVVKKIVVSLRAIAFKLNGGKSTRPSDYPLEIAALPKSRINGWIDSLLLPLTHLCGADRDLGGGQILAFIRLELQAMHLPLALVTTFKIVTHVLPEPALKKHLIIAILAIASSHPSLYEGKPTVLGASDVKMLEGAFDRLSQNLVSTISQLYLKPLVLESEKESQDPVRFCVDCKDTQCICLRTRIPVFVSEISFYAALAAFIIQHKAASIMDLSQCIQDGLPGDQSAVHSWHWLSLPFETLMSVEPQSYRFNEATDSHTPPVLSAALSPAFGILEEAGLPLQTLLVAVSQSMVIRIDRDTLIVHYGLAALNEVLLRCMYPTADKVWIERPHVSSTAGFAGIGGIRGTHSRMCLPLVQGPSVYVALHGWAGITSRLAKGDLVAKEACEMVEMWTSQVTTIYAKLDGEYRSLPDGAVSVLASVTECMLYDAKTRIHDAILQPGSHPRHDLDETLATTLAAIPFALLNFYETLPLIVTMLRCALTSMKYVDGMGGYPSVALWVIRYIGAHYYNFVPNEKETNYGDAGVLDSDLVYATVKWYLGPAYAWAKYAKMRSLVPNMLQEVSAFATGHENCHTVPCRGCADYSQLLSHYPFQLPASAIVPPPPFVDKLAPGSSTTVLSLLRYASMWNEDDHFLGVNEHRIRVIYRDVRQEAARLYAMLLNSRGEGTAPVEEEERKLDDRIGFVHNDDEFVSLSLARSHHYPIPSQVGLLISQLATLESKRPEDFDVQTRILWVLLILDLRGQIPTSEQQSISRLAERFPESLDSILTYFIERLEGSMFEKVLSSAVFGNHRLNSGHAFRSPFFKAIDSVKDGSLQVTQGAIYLLKTYSFVEEWALLSLAAERIKEDLKPKMWMIPELANHVILTADVANDLMNRLNRHDVNILYETYSEGPQPIDVLVRLLQPLINLRDPESLRHTDFFSRALHLCEYPLYTFLEQELESPIVTCLIILVAYSSKQADQLASRAIQANRFDLSFAGFTLIDSIILSICSILLELKAPIYIQDYAVRPSQLFMQHTSSFVNDIVVQYLLSLEVPLGTTPPPPVTSIVHKWVLSLLRIWLHGMFLNADEAGKFIKQLSLAVDVSSQLESMSPTGTTAAAPNPPTVYVAPLIAYPLTTIQNFLLRSQQHQEVCRQTLAAFLLQNNSPYSDARVILSLLRSMCLCPFWLKVDSVYQSVRRLILHYSSNSLAVLRRHIEKKVVAAGASSLQFAASFPVLSDPAKMFVDNYDPYTAHIRLVDTMAQLGGALICASRTASQLSLIPTLHAPLCILTDILPSFLYTQSNGQHITDFVLFRSLEFIAYAPPDVPVSLSPNSFSPSYPKKPVHSVLEDVLTGLLSVQFEGTTLFKGQRFEVPLFLGKNGTSWTPEDVCNSYLIWYSLHSIQLVSFLLNATGRDLEVTITDPVSQTSAIASLTALRHLEWNLEMGERTAEVLETLNPYHAEELITHLYNPKTPIPCLLPLVNVTAELDPYMMTSEDPIYLMLRPCPIRDRLQIQDKSRTSDDSVALLLRRLSLTTLVDGPETTYLHTPPDPSQTTKPEVSEFVNHLFELTGSSAQAIIGRSVLHGYPPISAVPLLEATDSLGLALGANWGRIVIPENLIPFIRNPGRCLASSAISSEALVALSESRFFNRKSVLHWQNEDLLPIIVKLQEANAIDTNLLITLCWQCWLKYERGGENLDVQLLGQVVLKAVQTRDVSNIHSAENFLSLFARTFSRTDYISTELTVPQQMLLLLALDYAQEANLKNIALTILPHTCQFWSALVEFLLIPSIPMVSVVANYTQSKHPLATRLPANEMSHPTFYTYKLRLKSQVLAYVQNDKLTNKLCSTAYEIDPLISPYGTGLLTALFDAARNHSRRKFLTITPSATGSQQASQSPTSKVSATSEIPIDSKAVNSTEIARRAMIADTDFSCALLHYLWKVSPESAGTALSRCFRTLLDWGLSRYVARRVLAHLNYLGPPSAANQVTVHCDLLDKLSTLGHLSIEAVSKLPMLSEVPLADLLKRRALCSLLDHAKFGLVPLGMLEIPDPSIPSHISWWPVSARCRYAKYNLVPSNPASWVDALKASSPLPFIDDVAALWSASYPEVMIHSLLPDNLTMAYDADLKHISEYGNPKASSLDVSLLAPHSLLTRVVTRDVANDIMKLPCLISGDVTHSLIARNLVVWLKQNGRRVGIPLELCFREAQLGLKSSTGIVNTTGTSVQIGQCSLPDVLDYCYPDSNMTLVAKVRPLVESLVPSITSGPILRAVALDLGLVAPVTSSLIYGIGGKVLRSLDRVKLIINLIEHDLLPMSALLELYLQIAGDSVNPELISEHCNPKTVDPNNINRRITFEQRLLTYNLSEVIAVALGLWCHSITFEFELAVHEIIKRLSNSSVDQDISRLEMIDKLRESTMIAKKGNSMTTMDPLPRLVWPSVQPNTQGTPVERRNIAKAFETNDPIDATIGVFLSQQFSRKLNQWSSLTNITRHAAVKLRATSSAKLQDWSTLEELVTGHELENPLARDLDALGKLPQLAIVKNAGVMVSGATSSSEINDLLWIAYPATDIVSLCTKLKAQSDEALIKVFQSLNHGLADAHRRFLLYQDILSLQAVHETVRGAHVVLHFIEQFFVTLNQQVVESAEGSTVLLRFPPNDVYSALIRSFRQTVPAASPTLDGVSELFVRRNFLFALYTSLVNRWPASLTCSPQASQLQMYVTHNLQDLTWTMLRFVRLACINFHVPLVASTLLSRIRPPTLPNVGVNENLEVLLEKIATLLTPELSTSLVPDAPCPSSLALAALNLLGAVPLDSNEITSPQTRMPAVNTSPLGNTSYPNTWNDDMTVKEFGPLRRLFSQAMKIIGPEKKAFLQHFWTLTSVTSIQRLRAKVWFYRAKILLSLPNEISSVILIQENTTPGASFQKPLRQSQTLRELLEPGQIHYAAQPLALHPLDRTEPLYPELQQIVLKSLEDSLTENPLDGETWEYYGAAIRTAYTTLDYEKTCRAAVAYAISLILEPSRFFVSSAKVILQDLDLPMETRLALLDPVKLLPALYPYISERASLVPDQEGVRKCQELYFPRDEVQCEQEVGVTLLRLIENLKSAQPLVEFWLLGSALWWPVSAEPNRELQIQRARLIDPGTYKLTFIGGEEAMMRTKRGGAADVAEHNRQLTFMLLNSETPIKIRSFGVAIYVGSAKTFVMLTEGSEA